MKNKKGNGFTLVEMLIVLFIITVLTLLFIPQISKRADSVSDNGCDALKQMVNTQVTAYKLDNDKAPKTIQDLVSEGYITDDQTTCKNGEVITLSNDI